VRSEVVRVLEVHGVDPLEGNELVDVDGRACRRLDRAQLGVGEAHVVVALELVPLDQLVPLDDALAVRTVELLADARTALLVPRASSSSRTFAVAQLSGHLTPRRSSSMGATSARTARHYARPRAPPEGA